MDNDYPQVRTNKEQSPMEAAMEELRQEVARARGMQENVASALAPVLVPLDKEKGDGTCEPRPMLAPLVHDVREMAVQLSRITDSYGTLLAQLHI